MCMKTGQYPIGKASGGMETSSAIFYGENLERKRDERIRNVIIHEIASNGLANAVTETSWMMPGGKALPRILPYCLLK